MVFGCGIGFSSTDVSEVIRCKSLHEKPLFQWPDSDQQLPLALPKDDPAQAYSKHVRRPFFGYSVSEATIVAALL